MRKKRIGLVLVCTAVLSLSGCGNAEPADAEPAISEEELPGEVTPEEDGTGTQEEPQTTPAPEEEEPQASLDYTFSGTDAGKAGYAEGTLSFTSSKEGTYCLYWSNENGALEGYYEIAELDVQAGGTATFSFDYHTAIPADATKVIAAVKGNEEYPALDDAAAVYEIPAEKQLAYASGDALYTFNSFSDIHIDEEHFGETPAYWWECSEAHWRMLSQRMLILSFLPVIR